MDVERSLPGKVDDLLGQNVPVSDDDRHVRFELLQLLVQVRVLGVFRLEELDLFLEGDLLDGRMDYLA